MKYDLTKKRTKFAKRTLAVFSDALLDTLQDKAIEDIAVNDLCSMTNYPRATFYNYFDDIYDLLDYCWIRISDSIAIDNYAALKDEERTHVLFDRCYRYLHQNERTVREIIRYNPEGGRFQESLRRFIRAKISGIIEGCPCSEKFQVPRDMIAEHYANTIEMVLEWCFIRKNRISKEEALTTLDYLLGGL